MHDFLKVIFRMNHKYIKARLLGEFFTDRPSIDILYYPEKCDDKGELIKAGITCYLGEQHC